MRLELTKLQERLQTLLNSMIAQHQNFKLKKQPQAVSGSYFSLSKATYWNILFSTDLAPDISAGIDNVQRIYQVTCELSNIEPHTSHLQTQTGLITSLNYDLRPGITETNSRNISIWADLDLDLSANLYYGGLTTWVSCKPFLLKSSCNDFGKMEKRRKISSQLWLRMVENLNYILSR